MANDTTAFDNVQRANSEQERLLREQQKSVKALAKAQRKNSKLIRQNEKANARKTLRESGYSRPVILLNSKTGERIAVDPSDGRVLGRTYRLINGPTMESNYDRYRGTRDVFEQRKDGRLTTDEVQRQFERANRGRNVTQDARTTAKRTYPSNPTPEQMQAYIRHPDRYDIAGYDAPPNSETPSKRRTTGNSGKCRNCNAKYEPDVYWKYIPDPSTVGKKYESGSVHQYTNMMTEGGRVKDLGPVHYGNKQSCYGYIGAKTRAYGGKKRRC